MKKISKHIQKLTLTKKWQEYGTIYSFSFSPDTLVPYKAGQYVHLMLPGFLPFIGPHREFSFASAPGDDDIRFTVETASGSKYQKRLLALEPGEEVYMFIGTRNNMTLPDEAQSTCVFIAGGVGMTPFRSLLRDIERQKLAVTPILIHVGNKYLYEDEFKNKPFEQHRIGRTELDTTLGTVVKGDKQRYFIAGSSGFVNAVIAKLKNLGVSKESIYRDDFRGLKG